MKSLYLAAALALAGCAGDGLPELSEVGDFTLKDLKNARAIALRGDDVLALQCYNYLIPKLESRLTAAEPAEISGAISAYQQARNVRLLIESRDSVGFRLACGPMLADSEAFLRRLGAGILGPL